MLKRVVLVALVALIGAGCHWLDPRPGLGPNLVVHVGPPGTAGARTVDVTAPGLADGAPARTRVYLDRPGGAVLATGTTLPLRFALDVNALGPHPHALFVQSRITRHERRRGLALVDASLRVNQLQALGTHNSYHVAPTEPPISLVEPLQYGEDPLDVQLQSQGVRQFELDVNTANDGSGRLDVLHLPTLDEGTTCRALIDCLNTIKTWSLAHPQHAIIGIQLELEANEFHLPAPYGPWGAADYDRLDATIHSVFDAAHLFTPDDLRGAHATLPAAIAEDGWPTIDSTRGQVMFVMDNGGAFRTDYLAGHAALAGRVVFTNADPGADDAAFIKRNDPKGSLADIQGLIAQGYVVRTRADADTVQARVNDTTSRDAAFVGGATWVSTDYPVPGRAFGTPYFVQIPGGTPARCNPINTPTWCTSVMIESLP